MGFRRTGRGGTGPRVCRVRVDGSPLEYNVRETYLPDLVVCRADLADAILGAIAASAEV